MPGQNNEERQALIFEALEIVQNELTLRLEERNEALKQRMSCGVNARDEVVENDHTHTMRYCNELLMGGIGELEYDENDTSCSPLFLPVDHIPPTGIEALAIVLGHEDDVLSHLRQLKTEHHFLYERMMNESLQQELMSLQVETGRRMREFEEDSTRLSFLAEQMEQELQQSTNAGKISMLRNMNSALRKTIRGIDRVKCCMQMQTASQSISSSRYKTQVNLYSLDTYSEVTQNSIPSTLLKTENKFLHEKAQRCILEMQLRWLQDMVDEYLVF